MPYVNVKVKGALSREQKEKISQDITDSLEKHAGKPPQDTYIVFDEVPGQNWAVGGKLLELSDSA